MAIDILESKVVGTNKETWYKLIGTKDDTKPTGEFPAGTGHTVAKDSTFFEIGTEIRYEFDGSAWQPKGQVPVTLIEKEITQNGVYSASDDNADGYSSVDVEVEINTGTKNITSNGTYKAVDDELEGYSEVTVNVVSENNAKFKSTSTFAIKPNLEKIELPNGITTIGANAFDSCTSLREIAIPDDVVTVDNSAFYGCSNLNKITIGSSVTTLEAKAFAYCRTLSEIIFKPIVPPTAATNSFLEMGTQAVTVIKVPAGSLSAYTSASNYPVPGVSFIYEEF